MNRDMKMMRPAGGPPGPKLIMPAMKIVITMANRDMSAPYAMLE
jgi:hypothetical protein